MSTCHISALQKETASVYKAEEDTVFFLFVLFFFLTHFYLLTRAGVETAERRIFLGKQED